MHLRTDEEVLKECDGLGEAAVEAGLKTGHFSDNSGPAHEWLIQRRLKSESRRIQQEIGYTRNAVYASWFLVVITFGGVWLQNKDARDQHELAKTQLELQRKDNQAQRDDARALLAVQISVELDRQFDSPDMRQTRRRLSTQLLNNKIVSENRVQDFFDKIGIYKHQGRIDKKTVYSSYSYWVKRYWLALQRSIEERRQLENDPDYYSDFEDLYKEMLATDVEGTKKSADLAVPSQREIRRFLMEEATLPP